MLENERSNNKKVVPLSGLKLFPCFLLIFGHHVSPRETTQVDCPHEANTNAGEGYIDIHCNFSSKIALYPPYFVPAPIRGNNYMAYHNTSPKSLIITNCKLVLNIVRDIRTSEQTSITSLRYQKPTSIKFKASSNLTPK